jgi:hypothetical protein
MMLGSWERKKLRSWEGGKVGGREAISKSEFGMRKSEKKRGLSDED